MDQQSIQTNPSTSLNQAIQKASTTTSDFAFPGMEQIQETANENNTYSARFFSFVDLEEDGTPAAKLRLEFKNGNRSFFPYAYLLRVEYDTTGIITLTTSEQEIMIKGRGLDILEEYLYESQVKVIRESKVAMDSGQMQLFVKSIEVYDRNEKEE